MKLKFIHSGFFALITIVASSQSQIQILFIGNSLTYVNDLPQQVKSIGDQDGVKVKFKMIAKPNYALIDHWEEEEIIKEIESGKYTHVVVQQGPSSQQEGRTLLIDYGIKLKALCEANNAKLCYYMVWPSLARFSDFDGVIKTYSMAADSTKSILCPAGKAWKVALESDQSLRLYGLDNFHPSVYGTYLAALVVYGSVTGKENFDFLDQKKVSRSTEMSEAVLKKLISAAESVLRE